MVATLGSRPGAPLEARLVAYGARRVALLRCAGDRVEMVQDWATDHRIAVRVSTTAWVSEPDPRLGGYLNVMRRASGSEVVTTPAACLYSIAVAAEPEDAEEVLWAEDASETASLGGLLGYPPCCTGAFAERWEDILAADRGDAVPGLLAQASQQAHPAAANVVGRYVGAELVFHFPCSLDCPASADVGARHHRALSRWEPGLAQWTVRVLEAPVLWSNVWGACFLVGARVDAVKGLLQWEPGDVLATSAGCPLLSARGGSARWSTDGEVSAEGLGVGVRIALFDAGDLRVRGSVEERAA